MHDEPVPQDYEIAQSITVSVGAVEEAVLALKSRTMELHHMASQLETAEARAKVRLLADQAESFAEEFRREARSVERFLRRKQRKL